MSPPVDCGIGRLLSGITTLVVVVTEAGKYENAGGGGEAISEDATTFVEETYVFINVPLRVRSVSVAIVELDCGLNNATTAAPEETVLPDTVVEKS